MEFFGVTGEAAEEWVGELEPEECVVWSENWLTVQVFLAMQTQWSFASRLTGAFRTGLRYEALPFILGALKIPSDSKPELFEGIQRMEAAALKTFNEEQQQK